jgi:hypothetical protein
MPLRRGAQMLRLYLYGLFSNALNHPKTVGPKAQNKKLSDKAAIALLQILYQILLENMSKTMKNHVMTTGVAEEIRTEQLLSTNQNLFDEMAILVSCIDKYLRNILHQFARQ